MQGSRWQRRSHGLGGQAMRALQVQLAPAAAPQVLLLGAAQQLRRLVQGRKDAGAPISAQDVTDLQALAASGKAAFAGTGAAADYLS